MVATVCQEKCWGTAFKYTWKYEFHISLSIFFSFSCDSALAATLNNYSQIKSPAATLSTEREHLRGNKLSVKWYCGLIHCTLMSNSLLYYIVHCEASALWKNSVWEGRCIYGSLVTVFHMKTLTFLWYAHTLCTRGPVQEAASVYHHAITVKPRIETVFNKGRLKQIETHIKMSPDK